MANKKNNTKAATPDVEPVEDQEPALAEVANEFDAAEESYDLSTMPALKGMNHLLPSARFAFKRKVLDVAAMLPEDWQDGEINISEEDLLKDGSTFQKLEDLIIAAEDIVLDQAEDREAMTKWLIAQEDGESAVMAAFGRVAERMGN
ncbi:hypothetical protein [Corynebacterium lubricantis]|uniref:hypothetical protein n=1 Tax=Corynebacterium lubricantis TaxID=541095 RepID=UPI000362DED9|nr:hypothetical protein [Corynebacterium lubricantis]